jgi:hypothetical protein
MLKRFINYIFPAYKLKFKRGDKVLIDKILIKETYGYVLDMEYSGVVLKTFTASSIFDGLCLDKFQDDKYTQIYLVRLNFTTGSTPYTGSDEEIWFTERNLSFVSKVDDRDYKINNLLHD